MISGGRQVYQLAESNPDPGSGWLRKAIFMKTDEKKTSTELTPALEDYLETIFLLERDRGYVRVRDIAKARNVRSGSVSPALKRLAELGLVQYVRRESIGLTESGKAAARRVVARHDLLSRFFTEVLQMDPDSAEREACAMEHNLSSKGMDKFARFFEFIGADQAEHPEWIERLHRFAATGESAAVPAGGESSPVHAEPSEETMTLLKLEPGEEGRVKQVNAEGAIRQRLLDMGLLPDVTLRVERLAPTGDPIWISCKGSQLALRRKEAESVLITRK